MNNPNEVLVRRIVDESMDYRSAEMVLALQAEFQRRSYRYAREGHEIIQQRIGDLVELTGEDLGFFNFPAKAGMLGKVIGLSHNGRIGKMVIVDHEGDFVEQSFGAHHVRTLRRESNDLFN